MKYFKFFRICFLIPILLSNVHFLSRRVVYECIENIEITNNNNNNFLKDLYLINFIILFNFENLIYKLKKEFHYYLFSTLTEKFQFFFYQLFFYKKECNETFIKYLYFLLWTLFEFIQLIPLITTLPSPPYINLFSLSHYRYRLVFFTIIALFYFSPTTG